MKKSLALIFVSIFFVASCGSSQKKTSRADYRKGGDSQRYYPRGEYSIDDIIYDNLEHRRGSGIHYSKYIKQNGKFDIPYTRNKYVEKWITYFTGRGRGHFSRYLARLGRFMPYIHSVLDHYQVPRDIVYLSMIESGFNIRAKSWASAVGPWQFIRSTGAMYGLSVDYYIDERRDVQKATHAAARHLKDLYDEFGHWYLAFAAYNAGSGKVRGAIKRNGNDYWSMVRGRYLRQETKDYVPKIIAAAIISKNPTKYGFTKIRYQMDVPFETVNMKGPTGLDVAADCAGVDPDLIRLLNPELLRDMTPPQLPNYALKIPRGTKNRFVKKYASLRPSQRVRTNFYVTDKGDTVNGIAEQFGVKPKELAEANSGKIHVSKKRYTKKYKVRYRRKGKTRWRWKNKRYTVASYSVRPGQKLTIPRSMSAYSSFRDDEAAYRAEGQYGSRVARLDKESDKKKKKKKKKSKKDIAKLEKESAPPVKSDLDPLPTSAQRKSDLDEVGYVLASDSGAQKGTPMDFGEPAGSGSAKAPSDAELKTAVGQLRGTSDVPDLTGDPGAKEKEWVPEAPKYHVVKSGETLGGIAKKYGVRVSSLKEWNGKKVSPMLLKGAKIRVQEPTGGSARVAQAAPSSSETVGSRKYYRVRPGDTLSQIARRNRVSVAQLKKWNGKKVSPVLRSGTKIIVRGTSVVKYKVRPGDNLTKIAKKHSTTAANIKKLNGLKSHVIKPGAVLVVRRNK